MDGDIDGEILGLCDGDVLGLIDGDSLGLAEGEGDEKSTVFANSTQGLYAAVSVSFSPKSVPESSPIEILE
jgi:hypothetical protein